MTENPDFSLTVAPDEIVTVTVTKKFSPFAATFSPLVGPAAWNGAVPTTPDGLTVTNGFTAPPTVGAIVIGTIIYDFRPDGTGNTVPGDSYHQTVTGSNGGGATPVDMFPPGISSQTLTFIVG